MMNKYSVSEMCEHSQELFGIYPEIICGAMLGKENEEHTIDEMKEIIDNFMKKEVS